MLYLLTPTMGVFPLNGSGIARTIPAGTILRIDIPLTAGDYTVEIDCCGVPVRVFAVDILARAIRLE